MSETEPIPATSLSFVEHRDENFGIEFEMPDSWEAGPLPMPYSCIECVVVGPAGASAPHGLSVYEVTAVESSCPQFPRCDGGLPSFRANRKLFDGDEREVLAGDYAALQQRAFVQPPLGVTNETGDFRLYRHIDTVIDTPRDMDLMVVGFYREDDEVGRMAVEAAYERVLETLVIQ